MSIISTFPENYLYFAIFEGIPPDTILKGLNYKTEIRDSQIFRQESYGSNFWLQAKIVNLNVLVDSGDIKINPEVNKEYNELFKEFEDNSLIPYEIITTANKGS